MPDGLLPPYRGRPGEEDNHSPWLTDLCELVQRFGTSTRRREVLRGFLRYRRALWEAGIREGFQWVAGSLVERDREPEDVDVVTFSHVEDGEAFLLQHGELMDIAHLRREYGVDGYFVDTAESAFFLVDAVAYWHGLFSHQRLSERWKGMLLIELGASDFDCRAAAMLEDL